MVQHTGRVVATDERSYALRFCPGTLTVEPERLTVQGTPLATGHPRKPVVTERSEIATLRLACGLFGGTLERELSSGYASCVIRTKQWQPLLDDLLANGWPVETTGWRRPR